MRAVSSKVREAALRLIYDGCRRARDQVPTDQYNGWDTGCCTEEGLG
jgi:hypothetical protein